MHTQDLSGKFDVIIIGSGLVGSILAAILAKHNLRILTIDKNAHPRFVIGEAMTPDTDLMMSILSHQYSIPELNYLSSFENICDYISPSACGKKRSFNFIYHHEGEPQTLKETNKVGVHPSSHLFRQEIDTFIAQVSVKYGNKLLENTAIKNIDIDRQGVTVTVDNGDKFAAQYIVDAGGYRSPLSEKFSLRENPTRFKTHSRSIFTHMTGVKRYDNCVLQSNARLPWYEGTLHHIFDGGWMWVIPFDNHQQSQNPLCSVGINFDVRRFPKTESPEQEFKHFLDRFPGIAVQFEDAKPVRDWISTGRLQYSSRACVGDRFYLLPHASGFVDALYSFGLVNSCTVIIPLAQRIMQAIADNDYAPEKFQDIELLQQNLLDYNDNLINCSYISFANFKLWDAWRRVWLIGSFIRQAKAGLSIRLKIDAGKTQSLAEIANDNLARLTPSYEGLGDDFFQAATATVEEVQAGLLSPDEAAERLMSAINNIDFLPRNFWKLGDASQTDVDTESELFRAEYSRFLSWVKTAKKPEIKKHFDYDMKDLMAAVKLAATKG